MMGYRTLYIYFSCISLRFISVLYYKFCLACISFGSTSDEQGAVTKFCNIQQHGTGLQTRVSEVLGAPRGVPSQLEPMLAPQNVTGILGGAA